MSKLIDVSHITSLTANNVNLHVNNNTSLTGAVVAATDAQGNDTGKLNLTTNTLTTENLTDTHYNSNTGFSVGANIGLAQESKNPQPNTNTQDESKAQSNKINTVSASFNTSTDASASKTLATIGNGTLTVGDTTNSTDTTTLNRDITKTEKTLYSSNTGTKVDATLDNSLLTVDGRKQIANDFKINAIVVDSIEDVITKDSRELKNLFDDTSKNINMYEGISQAIASDPQLQKDLTSPDLTKEQKDAMLQSVINAVAINLGYIAPTISTVSTDETGKNGELIQGHYNDGTAYINDKYANSTSTLVLDAGHELAHAEDKQDGTIWQNEALKEENANIIGSKIAIYTDFAVWNNGGTIASTNNHVNMNTDYPSVFNQSVIQANGAFAKVDKSTGEDLGVQGALIGGGIELALQVGPEFAKQYYQNGGDLTKIDYSAIAQNINLTNIGLMAGIGALTSNELNALNAVMKIKESWSAYQKYGKLAEETTTNLTKQARFEGKAADSKNVIRDVVGQQVGLSILKTGLKYLGNTGNSDGK